MKPRHQILGSALLALATVLSVSPALASDDCDAPASRWQSRESVRQMAVQKGWEIHRLKIDDGCYEVRGTDAEGRGFKAKIDPSTLSIVKMKRKGRHDDDHSRVRQQPAGSGMTSTSGAPPSNKLFESGEKPKTAVK